MFRKARRDTDNENRADNEEAYNKRVEQMNKKPAKKEVVLDDGDDFLKGLETFGEND